MRKISLAIALLSCSALSALAGSASVVWLAVDPADPAGGDEISVRLFEGEPFHGKEQAYAPERTALFQHISRKSRRHIPATHDTGAIVRSQAEAGPQLIAYSSRGLSDGSGGRVNYFCKLLLVVGDGATDSPLRYSELGQRLEIVPQTDPGLLLAKGGSLELQVLFEREPLYDVTVLAIPEAAPQAGRKRAITDEIGLARLTLDRPGLWMIKVVHELPASGRERFVSTLMLTSGAK